MKIEPAVQPELPETGWKPSGLEPPVNRVCPVQEPEPPEGMAGRFRFVIFSNLNGFRTENRRFLNRGDL